MQFQNFILEHFYDKSQLKFNKAIKGVHWAHEKDRPQSRNIPALLPHTYNFSTQLILQENKPEIFGAMTYIVLFPYFKVMLKSAHGAQISKSVEFL